MKQFLFFSALCYSLVMASCGGGATEKTSDESTAVQPVQQDSLQASADSLEVDGTTELPRWPMHLLLTVS